MSVVCPYVCNEITVKNVHTYGKSKEAKYIHMYSLINDIENDIFNVMERKVID